MSIVPKFLEELKSNGYAKPFSSIKLKYVIKLINEIDLIEKASEIAIKNKISLYDSLYIALALKEGAKLLTLDTIQAQAAKEWHRNHQSLRSKNKRIEENGFYFLEVIAR